MNPEHRIEIGYLPKDAESYLSLRDRLATTPHGGAAMLVVALVLYAEDNLLGLQCLTAAIDASHLVDGAHGLQGKEPSSVVQRNLRERLQGRPWIARSYIEGTQVAEGYRLPTTPLLVRIREQPRDIGPKDSKVFVFSSGADSPRPTRLLLSPRGLWKAKEWSSLEVGVRQPVQSPSPMEDI